MYYKDIGLVNTRIMYEKAYEGGYAIPAFNFVCLEQLQAIVQACMETKSPMIVQASANVVADIGKHMVIRMVQACIELLEENSVDIPIALNLDHGLTFEDCVMGIENGFSSVMIDGSALPYEENIALTKKVVDFAHRYDVCVEGELGTLSGIEEGVSHAESVFTDPHMAQDFVKRTGVDSLAISIGTSHGLVKIAPNPDGSIPELRYDVLEEVMRLLPGFPIVLHGASEIPKRFVDMINEHGGDIRVAQGIPAAQVKKAAGMGVCKVNVASDGWIAMVATTRKVLDDNKGIIDPRKFLKASRKAMTEMYIYKIDEVLGSSQR